MRKIFSLCIFMLLLLSGCSPKVPNESEILEALSVDSTFMEWANLASVSIERSKTEDRNFTADLSFKASDQYANYEGTVTVSYNLYDSGKWLLDGYQNLHYDTTCFRRPSYSDIMRMCVEDFEGVAKNVAISIGEKTATLDYNDEFAIETVLYYGLADYLVNSNPETLAEVRKVVGNSSDFMESELEDALAQYSDNPTPLLEIVEGEPWFVQWPSNGDYNSMDVHVFWNERFPHGIIISRYGKLRFNFQRGKWICENLNIIKSEATFHMSNMIFEGPNIIRIEYGDNQQIELLYADGVRYTFVSDYSPRDLPDVFNNSGFHVTYHAEYEGPSDYGGIGDVQVFGYGIGEYDKLTIMDFQNEIPSLILSSSSHPGTHRLVYTYDA